MARPKQDKTAPRRIGVKTFRGNIDTLLREARMGNSFLVTSRGEVLAEIRPPTGIVRDVRSPGALRGRIRMAADFDAFPPDELAAMTGEVSAPTLRPEELTAIRAPARSGHGPR